MQEKSVSKVKICRSNETDFDAAMAALLTLITHHSLTQCPGATVPIVERLESLLQNPEINFFPQQRDVVVKMHRLWLVQQSGCQRHH